MTDLNITTFRATFPAFADENVYPDATLELWYSTGKCYLKDNDCVLPPECRENALMMMLAHLLYIQDMIASGQAARQIASAGEGDVNLSLVEPPNSSNFSYWLNISPYGGMILSMLEIAFGGGMYIGSCTPRPKLSGGF